MNMVLDSMIELATWDRTHKEIVDRSHSPWDAPNRRPSHADATISCAGQIVTNELIAACNTNSIPTKIKNCLKRPINLEG